MGVTGRRAGKDAAPKFNFHHGNTAFLARICTVLEIIFGQQTVAVVLVQVPMQVGHWRNTTSKRLDNIGQRKGDSGHDSDDNQSCDFFYGDNDRTTLPPLQLLLVRVTTLM